MKLRGLLYFVGVIGLVVVWLGPLIDVVVSWIFGEGHWSFLPSGWLVIALALLSVWILGTVGDWMMVGGIWVVMLLLSLLLPYVQGIGDLPFVTWNAPRVFSWALFTCIFLAFYAISDLLQDKA